MSKSIFLIMSLIILTACSNSSDFETGEIKAIKNLEALLAIKTPTKILDTRNIITRKKLMTPKYQCFHGIRKWTKRNTDTLSWPRRWRNMAWRRWCNRHLRTRRSQNSKGDEGWCHGRHHQCLCGQILETLRNIPAKFIIFEETIKHTLKDSLCYQKAY